MPTIGGEEGARSRPARGAWVEISTVHDGELTDLMSRPARGAWVEIFLLADYAPIEGAVAPRKGRVG